MANLGTENLGIAGVTALVVQGLNLLFLRRDKAKQEKVDFQAMLIEERANLVKELGERATEIKDLSQRFAALEAENHSIRQGQIELQQQISMLQIERERDKAEIQRLKGLLGTDEQTPNSPA